MNDITHLLLAAGTGIILGFMYYGGLWITIRKAMSSKQPVGWYLASYLLRTVIVLGGFYLVGAGHWTQMLTCLSGFVLARLLVTRYTKRVPHENHT